MSKISSEYDNGLVLCDIAGEEFEVRRFVIPFLKRLADIDKPEDMIVLMEESDDQIAEITHSLLPDYRVLWTSKENGCCPYCDQDGIRYEDQFCPQCLGVFEPPNSEYVMKFLVHNFPFSPPVDIEKDA